MLQNNDHDDDDDDDNDHDDDDDDDDDETASAFLNLQIHSRQFDSMAQRQISAILEKNHLC